MSRRRGLWAATGAGLLLTNLTVALVGAGPLLFAAVGGPARFWDDETAREWQSRVSANTKPGGLLFVFDAPYETLRGRSDVPILFREPPEGPDGNSLRRTAIYRFLKEETVLVERIDARTG